MTSVVVKVVKKLMLTDHVSSQHIKFVDKTFGLPFTRGPGRSSNRKLKVNIACVHLGQSFDAVSRTIFKFDLKSFYLTHHNIIILYTPYHYIEVTFVHPYEWKVTVSDSTQTKNRYLWTWEVTTHPNDTAGYGPSRD